MGHQGKAFYLGEKQKHNVKKPRKKPVFRFFFSIHIDTENYLPSEKIFERKT